jgi:hypothetical protein
MSAATSMLAIYTAQRPHFFIYVTPIARETPSIG